MLKYKEGFGDPLELADLQAVVDDQALRIEQHTRRCRAEHINPVVGGDGVWFMHAQNFLNVAIEELIRRQKMHTETLRGQNENPDFAK